MFKTIDPGGKVRTLHGDNFYNWSINGTADPNFRYAIGMLPTSNEGHAVSIVRSKRHGDNRLILIDSNIGYPKLLSDEAYFFIGEVWEIRLSPPQSFPVDSEDVVRRG